MVRAFFSGHDHFGGYARDMSGVHFVTLQGVIETALNDVAFATVEVYGDRALVNGKGRQASYVLPFEMEEQGAGETPKLVGGNGGISGVWGGRTAGGGSGGAKPASLSSRAAAGG